MDCGRATLRKLKMRRISILASALALAAILVTAPISARAQNCSAEPSVTGAASWQAYKQWCRTCGGTVAEAFNTAQAQGGCKLPSRMGAPSIPTSVNEGAAALGAAIGAEIHNALFGNAQEEERQRVAAARAEADRQARRAADNERAQRLLGQMLDTNTTPSGSSQGLLGQMLDTNIAPSGSSQGLLGQMLDTDKPVALLRSGPGPDDIRWTPVPLAWREQRDVDFASAAAEGRIRLGSLENVRQLALYDYLLLPGSGSLQAALESNRWLGNFGPDEGIAAYLNGYTPGPANPFGQIAAIHDAKGAKWDDYAARVAGEQGPFDPRGWREAIVDAAPIQIRYLGSRVVYEVEYAFLIDSRNR